jgi:hypothetical protein
MVRIAWFWLASLALASAGLAGDALTGFTHNWFGRSGGLITCFSVLIPLITIRYTLRKLPPEGVIDRIFDDIGQESPRQRTIRRFEGLNKWSMILLAIIGTLINVFGDLAKNLFPSSPAAVEGQITLECVRGDKGARSLTCASKASMAQPNRRRGERSKGAKSTDDAVSRHSVTR